MMCYCVVDDCGWGDWKIECVWCGDMEICVFVYDSRDFVWYDGDCVEDFDGEFGNDFYVFGFLCVVRVVGVVDGEWIYCWN